MASASNSGPLEFKFRTGRGHAEAGAECGRVGVLTMAMLSGLDVSLEAMRSHGRCLSREGTQSNLDIYKVALVTARRMDWKS